MLISEDVKNVLATIRKEVNGTELSKIDLEQSNPVSVLEPEEYFKWKAERESIMKKISDILEGNAPPEPTKLSVMMITNKTDLDEFINRHKKLYDELVIVYTGEREKFLDLTLKQTIPKVAYYHYEWIGDFSLARNFAFSKCTMPWVMYLDDDDIVPLESIEIIRRDIIDNPGKRTRAQACYFMAQIHCGNMGATAKQPRIIPRLPDLRWINPVHESLVESLIVHGLCMVDVENLIILHTGYDNQEATLKRIKERNIPILLNAKPFPLRNFYLGREYLVIGEFENALKHLTEMDEYKDKFSFEFTGEMNYLIGRCHFCMNDLEKAEAYFLISMKKDVLCWLGELFFKRGKWKKAETALKDYLGYGTYTDFWGTDVKVLRYNAYIKLITLSARELKERLIKEYPEAVGKSA